MPRHTGTADQTAIAARRERVAALYLSGQSQHAISLSEKCDRATISRDLTALRVQWRETAIRDFSERQSEELAKVDRLESEAWAAWERSKANAEIETVEKVGRKKGKTTTRTEGRDGNPAFLAQVERCIAKRCEILGLYAPKNAELGKPAPDPMVVGGDAKPDELR